MRVLKSWLLLCACCWATWLPAQDVDEIIDTATVSLRDTATVFRADTPAQLQILQERNVPDTTVQRLRADDAFWYANANLKKNTATAPQRSFLADLFQQRWFYTLLWVLIVGSFLAVIFLFLARSNVVLFRRKALSISEVEALKIEENIFTINYPEALQKAEAQGDYRLAIRLHFLQTLALLSQQHRIQYNEGRTNSDYGMQLYGTPQYEGFKNVTRHFEYAWYGKFPVSATIYAVIAADFSNFKKGMGI